MVPRILNNKKMEKYYLENGKEVQIGDTVTKTTEMSHPSLGECTIKTSAVVTEENIPRLLEAGIIFKDTVEEEEKEVNLYYYVEKLAERFGWKPEKMSNYLDTIDDVYPAAAFSMILREIAIELDEKYEGHIKESPEIYVISMFDGRIIKANKAHIKNYRNFAAFRSIEDAKFACRVTRELLKDMFNDKR